MPCRVFLGKAVEDKNFKNIFNNINDFLFILDMNGNIIEVNNAVMSTLGYSKEELLGKSVLLVHPPEVRERAAETVGKMIAGERDSCPLQLLAKNNSQIPVETRVYKGTWDGQSVLIGVSRNLSEIALSEQKFFEVFDHSQVLMAISEMETGTFVNVNKPFLKALGYAEAEILGKSSRELNLFRDYAKRQEIIKKLSANESVDNVELEINTKSGGVLQCLFSATPLQIQTHRYLLTSASDITQRKIAENRLKHNLHQQSLLADIAQKLNQPGPLPPKLDLVLGLIGEHTNVSRIYIFEDDADGKSSSNTYEWCNHGISAQKEALQALPYELIPSWKRILQEQGRVFSTDITRLPQDLVAVLQPQGIKSLLVFPLFVRGKFFGFIGYDECSVSRDWGTDEIELLRTVASIIAGTFERVGFQKQLAQSEAQLKMAIENTEAGVWDWEIPTGHVYFNEIWYKMLGYNPGDIEPNVKSWEKLLHPEDMPGVLDILRRHLSGEAEVYQSVHRLRTKGGGWKWIMDKGRIIERDANGNPLRAIGTHIDLDAQKKTESDLRAANATKDKFFSIISHDLRGPMATMMQMAEFISKRHSAVTPEIFERVLREQSTMSRNTFQLLENLLSWARYNRDQIERKPADLNLCEVAALELENARLPAGEKNISVVSACTEHLQVYADKDMVRLIIRNLFSNAVKFTRPGGEVRIAVAREGEFAQVTVSDNGVGMAPEDIEKVLSDHDFYSTYGTTNEKGSGLGLKLCRNFTAVNGGKFSISSEKGKGTAFSFTLPLHR